MLIYNKIIEQYHISAGDIIFFTHLGQFIRNCTINVPKKIISPLNAKLAERRPEIAIPSVPLFEGINVPPFSIGFMNFHERFKEFAFDICHNLKIVDILDVALKNNAANWQHMATKWSSKSTLQDYAICMLSVNEGNTKLHLLDPFLHQNQSQSIQRMHSESPLHLNMCAHTHSLFTT